MEEEDKIKAIAAMRVKMKENGTFMLDNDRIESFVEGIKSDISIGRWYDFRDAPYIAQKIDVGLDGDQVQVLPLNDNENNFYYCVIKYKSR